VSENFWGRVPEQSDHPSMAQSLSRLCALLVVGARFPSEKKAVTFVLWMVVVADLLPATFGLRSGFLLQVGSIVCN
jgi:hypothetical protein